MHPIFSFSVIFVLFQAILGHPQLKEGSGDDHEDTFEHHEFSLDLLEDLRTEVGDGSQLLTDEYSRTIRDFAHDMITELWTTSDNLVFSPFSLHTILAILTSGSTDNSTTQVELLNSLGRTRNIQGLEMQYSSLLKDYKQNLKGYLSFGNHIWTRGQFFGSIMGSFFERLDAIYQSSIGILSPTNPEGQINKWVRGATNGKIKKLYSTVPDNVVLLLANALYFKAAWKVAFEPLDPNTPLAKEARFRQGNGKIVQGVRMMSRTSVDFVVPKGAFDFEELPGVAFKAAAIPYDVEDARFEMVVVVPADNPRAVDFLGDALRSNRFDGQYSNIYDQIMERIDGERLSANSVEEKTLVLPRFVLESDLDVVKHLKNLGVNDAFKVGDFNKISSNQLLKVSNIKHKAIIEVDLEGTVGAAATGVDVVPLFGAFEDPRVFYVNKPFLFIIHDLKRQSLLFVGKVNNPEY